MKRMQYLCSAVFFIKIELKSAIFTCKPCSSVRVILDLMEKENVCLNFKLCIVCQYVKEEKIVGNPCSYERILAAIKETASDGKLRYSEVSSTLKNVSHQELEHKQTSWHKRCYQEFSHSWMLKRANERYERELTCPNELRRKSRNINEPEAIHQITRSNTTP